LPATVLGAMAVGAMELVAIGATRPALAGALLAVFAATGAIAGLVQALTLTLTRRLGWRGGRAALVHALPTLAIWIPVCGTLFEGAFAATLPGARVMPYLLPAVLTAGTAVAAALALWARGRGRWLDVVLAGLLVVVFAVLWFANHRLFRSGYNDLHAGLSICEIVVVGLVLRLLAPPADPGFRALGRIALAVAVAGAFAAALFLGLGDAGDRRRITDHGDDTRHVVRLWRSLLDLDGDGTSAVLGGGDCDDGNAARHPGARDIPGNDVDEDCDGRDTVPRAPSPKAVEQARSIADWQKQPDVIAALARTAPMNVLVISVDALRYDAVAPDAPHRGDFPNLTALLDGSVWFERAVAPAAGTDVSLTTFVTGRWLPFQPIERTLVETMKASGRATGVIFPREVLRYVPEALLTRGADDVTRIVADTAKRDVSNKITAGTTTDRALEFIGKAGDKPYFLWAHYFDVHEHHQLEIPDELLAAVDPGGSELEHGYRALAHGVDVEIGRLLAGIDDHTIVVLFADHGESFHEDPRLPDNHGVVVYQTLTHVPMAIRVPGAPARVDLEPVSLVDLAPTLIALTGATPPETLDGISLVPSLLGAPEALQHTDRALVMHEMEQWAVLEWPWKLLVRPAENLLELYDLEADPDERHDLATARPDLVDALKSRYGEFPEVPLDRTRAGRKWREQQAQPPGHP
jgi:hypothetical protein